MIFSKEFQLKNTLEGAGHLVILGAGASKASCLDNAEKKGMEIPLMEDLPNVIDLNNELNGLSEKLKSENFEKIFSQLYLEEGNSVRVKKIEEKLYDYFDKLELPDTPTIYDYLVLSLRNKDMIATFNWDPFIWQAYMRSRKTTTNLPNIIFLHGNVAIGYCEKSLRSGPKDAFSIKTNKRLTVTKLLYPIQQKNYNSDPFIKRQWQILQDYLNNSKIVTIFGYAAPVSDVEALSLMKNVWGNPLKERRMEQIEIINIESKDILEGKWKDFIHTHHYDITDSYFKSSLNKFPRRTGEAYKAQYIDAFWHEENYPPKFKTLNEMHDWFKKFYEYE